MLHELKSPEGSRKNRNRVGRGIGSGNGKTSGKGHKGQNARSGTGGRVGFEGGQMPLHRRLPKRGFNNPNAKTYAVTNICAIPAFVDAGKLDAGAKIDEAALVASGLIRRVKDGVRVLGRGEISAKMDIAVTGASKSAIAAVEAKGGSLTVSAPAAQEG